MIRTSILRILFFVAALISTMPEAVAQQGAAFKVPLGKLATYAKVNAPEKVYLQTDKDVYTSGEIIWFKAYVLDGITHTISDKSSVVYVELVDTGQDMIAQRKLFLGQEGASGDIAIPEDIEDGTYLLRAYTKYMLNDANPVLFEKEIDIYEQKINGKTTTKEIEVEENIPEEESGIAITSRPIIQFFPEGGDMVEGIEGVLGLKITDQKGNGIAIEGKIFDQNGKLIAIFKSFEFGLARTYFKVLPNTDYYAELQVEGKTERYPVPDALTKGYTLQVLNYGEYLRIRVATNVADGLKGSLLIGHLRGDLFLKQFYDKNDGDTTTIKLLTSKLRDGVAHFTLFTANGEPVCERLVFVANPKNEARLTLSTDKANYDFREEVDVSLALKDSKGKPLEGDFSMSVFTQKGLNQNPESIKSWLLLNSDVGGTVEDPNYFFDPIIKGRRFLLDLLMLTHGWRRFTWQSLTKKGFSKALAFQPEKGIMISGKTTAFDNAYQPKKAKTTLSIFAENMLQTKDSTNAQGKFSFGPYFFQDSVKTLINAESVTGAGKNKEELAIYLDSPFPKIKIKSQKIHSTDKVTVKYPTPYLKEARLKKQTDFKYDPKVTKLKEVVVKSKPETREERINKELDKRTLYGRASNRLFPDSIPWTRSGFFDIRNFLLQVPGVRVVGSLNLSVRIRGAIGPPLYLIDGIPVDGGTIQSISAFDVLFVDVLKGPAAAIYGVRGGGGVVAIYTKRGDNFDDAPERYPGVISNKIPGFYKTREFYAPKYAKNKPQLEKPDHRLTLHWNPSLVIKDNGTSKLNFFTGDSSGTYVMRVEGITYDGRPVSSVQYFRVGADKTKQKTLR